MSQIKLSLLTAFIAILVGAVVSNTAWSFSYLIEGKKLVGSETETTSTEGGEALFTSAGFQLSCAESTGTDTLEATGLTLYHKEFYRCRVITPCGCIVHERILTVGIDHAILLTPVAGHQILTCARSIARLTFLNKSPEMCALGETEVTGQITASLAGGEEAKEVAELNFTNTSGSAIQI